MKQLIFRTGNSFSPFILRVMLALVLLPHGAQKLLGWFGGYGFGGTMKFFTETVGLPYIVGFAVIIIEFFGALAIALGWATRLWSAAILVVMAGIIITSHHHYFFMNWFGAQKEEGAEFFILMIAIATALIISGGGRASIDSRLELGHKKPSSQ